MGTTIEVTNKTMLTGLPSELSGELRRMLTFPNPEYADREKRGLWLGDTHKELCFLERYGDTLFVPRGFTWRVIGLLRSRGTSYQLHDRRRILQAVDYSFTGDLRDYQREALDAILARNFGTISAPTGSGKTVIGLAAIAARRQPALIVVHTRELLQQWVDRIGTFLNIPNNEVGTIGGGKRKIGDKVTVALVQSLYKCAEEVAPQVGHLIIDECHRAPSKTFTDAITAFDCKYMLGLSATPYRRDGLGRLIYWFVGDVVHKVEQAALLETGAILRAEVVHRVTSFQTTVDPSTQYSTMLSELCEDQSRNSMIASDVIEELNTTGTMLILSDRKSHCQTLHDILGSRGIQAEVLTGDVSPSGRQGVVEKLASGKARVVVATGQLIGEGFDCRELSTLFLATPIRFEGRMVQYLGRILRPAPGKSVARVFDYVDPVGVLQASARARARVFQNAA